MLVKIFDEYCDSVAGQECGLQKWGMVGAKSGWNREKSLRHVAMVATFLDDNKPIKSL